MGADCLIRAVEEHCSRQQCSEEHLMFYACVERFDVMGGRGNILGWEGEVNEALLCIFP
jgi:hypothetical protein